jgi:hypothetical protein
MVELLNLQINIPSFSAKSVHPSVNLPTVVKRRKLENSQLPLFFLFLPFVMQTQDCFIHAGFRARVSPGTSRPGQVHFVYIWRHAMDIQHTIELIEGRQK